MRSLTTFCPDFVRLDLKRNRGNNGRRWVSSAKGYIIGTTTIIYGVLYDRDKCEGDQEACLIQDCINSGHLQSDKHEHFFAVSEGEDKIIRINDDCDPAFTKKQFEKAYQFSENNRSKILLAPFRLVYNNMTILTLSKLLAHNIS